MSRITTERLLTSPDAFGVMSATPVQRAACRVRDGLPLSNLASDPDVIAAFGGAHALLALPSERDIKPLEFWNIASARTAKTTMAVAAAIADTQTVDVSGLGPGEIPRLSILSLKLDVADVPFRRLVDTMQASAVLRPLVLSVGSDSVMVRHPSGHAIEIKVTAGGKAAGGLAARWSAGLILDEVTRMGSRDEAVTNADDAMSVVRERLLPGAQIAAIGSPWSPAGPAYDAVQTYFGKPTDEVVLMRTTGPAGNPSHWTPERLAKLQERDDVAWRINALGEFIEPEQGLLSPIAIHRNTRESPLQLRPENGARYCAAVDPSEGGQVGNGFTLVIVKFEPAALAHQSAKFRVALTEDFRGVGLEACWSAIAARCKTYGLDSAWTDQYSASASTALAKRYGLRLHVDKTSATSKLEDFTNLATLVHTDAVELPPDRTMRRDLLAVKRRATQAGMSIILPKTNDGRHCDFAPALVAAIKHARAAVHSNAYSRARDLRGGRTPTISAIGSPMTEGLRYTPKGFRP